MRTPKVTLPEEDPATKAAREREQQRAENTRTEETQAWLLGATGRRNRRFGALRAAGGSVPVAAPANVMSSGSAGAGVSMSNIASGSAGGSRFGGSNASLAVLY